MGESQGTCLFLFSLVSGKNKSSFRGNINWKEQIQYFQKSNEYAELFGIDGEPSEFEWNISQDSHRLRFSDIFRKI